MIDKPAISGRRQLSATSGVAVPAVILESGADAIRRFVEFFTANIRNLNTRLAYMRAVRRFCDWLDRRGVSLDRVEPVLVAAYVEELREAYSDLSVKQHLAAILGGHCGFYYQQVPEQPHVVERAEMSQMFQGTDSHLRVVAAQLQPRGVEIAPLAPQPRAGRLGQGGPLDFALIDDFRRGHALENTGHAVFGVAAAVDGRMATSQVIVDHNGTAVIRDDGRKWKPRRAHHGRVVAIAPQQIVEQPQLPHGALVAHRDPLGRASTAGLPIVEQGRNS